MNRVEHLAKVSLFHDIVKNAVAMDALAAKMDEKVYKPGVDIITEGEAGSELFILIQGHATVYKKTAEGALYKVALLSGEHHPFFGEGGLLDSDARSATIRADDESHCLVLSRTHFDELGVTHPDWCFPVLRRIAKVVMARFKKANHDQLMLYQALVSEIRGE